VPIEEDSITNGTPESAEKRYKVFLIDWWESIRALEAEVLTNWLFVSPLLESGKSPQNITVTEAEFSNTRKLLSSLITFWRELAPKIPGTAIAKEFAAFESYNDTPNKYIEDMEKVTALTKVLRDALEVLGVTKFEKEIR